jgi:signal recognition particle subunit SEC65
MQAAPVGQQVLTPEQRAEIMAKMRSAHTIYPQYIDATLSPEQGRRTTLQHAVAHPTLDEIFQALKHMGFTTVFCDPRKSLPKSQSQPYCIPPLRGVMKVVIKDGPSDGAKAAVVAKDPNESSVLRGIADFIKAIQKIKKPKRQSFADDTRDCAVCWAMLLHHDWHRISYPSMLRRLLRCISVARLPASRA